MGYKSVDLIRSALTKIRFKHGLLQFCHSLLGRRARVANSTYSVERPDKEDPACVTIGGTAFFNCSSWD
jgi:hypothetical protein